MTKSAEGKIAIAGAGLVGSLLAIFLRRRNLAVDVYEGRADPRGEEATAGRSINLVVTRRGLDALETVGLREETLKLTVPVLGRVMHGVDGGLAYQPYGRDDSECNYSISRGELNRFLIEQAEQAGARFHFSRRLVGAELDGGVLELADESGARTRAEADRVFGADGAGSALRAVLVRDYGCRESNEPLGYGYKELTIPATDQGGFRVRGDALHIWPRGEIMLMALPNRDGSFTVTLYLPEDGPSGFSSLDSPERVRSFFAERFPDAVPLLRNLAEEFVANPTGYLGTVRCEPWNVDERAALIGDAAHAVVPFFGQGMNCGFEDCTVLEELLGSQASPDWKRTLSTYAASRKRDADAIADMAIENFVEMRDHVGDPAFLLRKQVEHGLEQVAPGEYRSRYSMVMYSSIPYRIAMDAGRIQAGILDRVCAGLASVDDLDVDAALELVRNELTPFLREHRVRLDY